MENPNDLLFFQGRVQCQDIGTPCSGASAELTCASNIDWLAVAGSETCACPNREVARVKISGVQPQCKAVRRCGFLCCDKNASFCGSRCCDAEETCGQSLHDAKPCCAVANPKLLLAPEMAPYHNDFTTMLATHSCCAYGVGCLKAQGVNSRCCLDYGNHDCTDNPVLCEAQSSLLLLCLALLLASLATIFIWLRFVRRLRRVEPAAEAEPLQNSDSPYTYAAPPVAAAPEGPERLNEEPNLTSVGVYASIPSIAMLACDLQEGERWASPKQLS